MFCISVGNTGTLKDSLLGSLYFVWAKSSWQVLVEFFCLGASVPFCSVSFVLGPGLPHSDIEADFQEHLLSIPTLVYSVSWILSIFMA